MITKIFFTLSNAYINYSKIRNTKTIDHVTALQLNELVNNNIKVLMLDFDGVLNSYGEVCLNPDVQAWMANLLNNSDIKICILSNNMFKERKTFLQKIENLDIIHAIKPKPYPDTILNFMSEHNIAAKNILLIDDRYFTGVLAGVIAGINIFCISNPFTNYKKRWLIESLFLGLRFFERLLLGVSLNDVCGNRELYKL